MTGPLDLPLPGREGEEVELLRTEQVRHHEFTSRTKSRIRAIDVLFESDARGADVRETLEARRTLTATQTPLNEWSVHLVELYAAHAAEVDEQIATNAHDWPLRRMPAVDRALLRLGGAEILHDTAKEDIGPVIGDYVTITRALSTDQSPRFVEGVLQSLSAIRDLLG